MAIRADDRGPEEFRPMFYDTKVLSQSKGSCYCEIGDTKIMVGVFGPRQGEVKLGFSELGRLTCDVRCTSFAGSSSNKQEQTLKDKAMAASIIAALEPSVHLDTFPKAVVEVCVCILESAGGEVPAAITAASMALADAGIALKDLAPCCSVVRNGGVLQLDPTSSEMACSDGQVQICLMPSVNEVTQMFVTGCWGAQGPSLQQAIQLAMGGCVQLKDEMRSILVAKVPDSAGQNAALPAGVAVS